MRSPHPSALLGLAFLWTAKANTITLPQFQEGVGPYQVFSSLQTTQKGKDSLPRVLKQPSVKPLACILSILEAEI